MKRKIYYIIVCSIFCISILSSCSTVKKVAAQEKLTVDYTASVEQLIMNGNYWDYDHQINSVNFSTEKSHGKDTLEVVLVTFENKRHVSYNFVKKWMHKNSMRPASLKELQNYLNQTPDSLITAPIVAIGSVAIKVTEAPTAIVNLTNYGTKGFVPFWGEGWSVPGKCARNMTLEPWETGCGGSFQFLAVKIK